VGGKVLITKEGLYIFIACAFVFTCCLALFVEWLCNREDRLKKKEIEAYRAAKKRIEEGKGWDR
jgi:hypothetical protein